MLEAQKITAKASVSGHNRVTDFLRQQLIAGKLKVGDRLLPERELALRLDVSRPVVREALRSFEAMGIVEIRPGFGTVVKPLDTRIVGEFFGLAAMQHDYLLSDVFEVRIALERQAVWLACGRMRSSHRNSLLSAMRRIEETIDGPDAGGQADFDFHMALVAAAESPSLSGIYGVVAESLRSSHERIRRMIIDQSADNRQRMIDDHRAIIDALAAGDRERADRALMQRYWRAPGMAGLQDLPELPQD